MGRESGNIYGDHGRTGGKTAVGMATSDVSRRGCVRIGIIRAPAAGAIGVCGDRRGYCGVVCPPFVVPDGWPRDLRIAGGGTNTGTTIDLECRRAEVACGEQVFEHRGGSQ